MATTIKDIARQTGVSHSTVSRALSGNPLISSSTTERIRQAALAMGYQASAAARSLKTNRTNVIGVIVNSMDDPFFSQIVNGIESCGQEAGYSLFIAASQYDPQREKKIVQAMMEQRTDGVIICSTSFSSAQGRQLHRNGFPVVVVNYQAAENFHFSIYHDDVDGSRQIARHLIQLGHRDIAYLGNSLSGRTTLDRLTGYKAEMLAAGIPINESLIYHLQGGTAHTGFSSADYFLNQAITPTAIMCYNDLMAIGLLKALQERDILVPQQISVTGFDNITLSGYTSPALTTLDQPKRSIGEEAMRLLLSLLAKSNPDEPFQPTRKILKGNLLIRQSTCAPRQMSVKESAL